MSQPIPPIPTLLLIDDDEDDQFYNRRIADRSGAAQEVISFLSPLEALDYLRAGNPADAILLDIRMPSMNGFEFLETAISELGSSFEAIVIIMLTTSLNPSDQQRADGFTVVKGYLTKPPTTDDLWNTAKLVADRKPFGRSSPPTAPGTKTSSESVG